MKHNKDIKFMQKILRKQCGSDEGYFNILLLINKSINYFAGGAEQAEVKYITIKINNGYPTKLNLDTGKCTHYENMDI